MSGRLDQTKSSESLPTAPRALKIIAKGTVQWNCFTVKALSRPTMMMSVSDLHNHTLEAKNTSTQKTINIVSSTSIVNGLVFGD